MYHRGYYADTIGENATTIAGHVCHLDWPGIGERLAYGTIWAILYEILPLMLIMGFNYTAFRILREQMKSFDGNSNTKRCSVLKKASKTFCLVAVAFFVCTLPAAIFQVTTRYLVVYDLEYVKRHMKDISRAHNYLVKLTNVNSCLNPVIYSKVHMKLWKLTHSLYRRVSKLNPPLIKKQETLIKKHHPSDTIETTL